MTGQAKPCAWQTFSQRKGATRQSHNRTARSAWSARSLLPLSNHPRCPTGPASWAHSIRFAWQFIQQNLRRLRAFGVARCSGLEKSRTSSTVPSSARRLAWAKTNSSKWNRVSAHGVLMREEEDQAAPPFRELVQEQPALAACPGGAAAAGSRTAHSSKHTRALYL